MIEDSKSRMKRLEIQRRKVVNQGSNDVIIPIPYIPPITSNWSNNTPDTSSSYSGGGGDSGGGGSSGDF